MSLLEIENLTVEFGSGDKPFRAVEDVSFSVDAGEVLGIVGESGSGKSVSSLAMMGLVAYPGRVKASKMVFDGIDLLTLSGRQRRKLTGSDVAMIFQEPMTSLNPCFTIGYQITETLKIHQGGTRAQRRDRAIELLSQVGIPDPGSRLGLFPHQLSGGMSQRVMIAMAVACDPRLLIADEPTTALDVTIQAQIMHLLLTLQEKRGMGMVLITHDLAVVAEAAHRVVVMYAGQVMETGAVPAIFDRPHHPYTAALLEALPERAEGKRRLNTIPGVVPGAHDRPKGCLLAPRCAFAQDRCRAERPSLTPTDSGQVRCFFPLSAPDPLKAPPPAALDIDIRGEARP
ncbi:oligopeptide/dipeptide ABC transporter ATP-binding protein [Rhodospirillum rubrum]|uniref:Oligopeptide/dipeptide ABC transporter, ATP-binding protein-like n=1 Tax=Rhodospirillum rubrum (strain ATCC 11170 / ATH 1.1.1 / DSM 467 / LMG 4362 / NCIMB 8255 / S1) TaxID=269796 RepID=Q2RRT6_RHORT|nr:oligopeptide/dipeptide ABC transporter ATP-binding protein [Rhodospirillum rubrum]ABC23159.1 Oligopeptide/dipeptide ABC transporter, ATP-binding protein-like [Rhodospirillum rubrum ATCC 11170]AEO48890.1 oligopeptide/dipeptide ABC transporter ATP-binding protein-like protein [Rhodospirillum rubrum F11]MBK5954793.1 ABC transporter ATP-binding protein [Rhodospirillum rubrum]QXG79140.1 ATP-binding cassette domain-containing protein [Rhodospirillum rubrum]HAQ00111.1 ABC transporter ATP-binding p